MSKGFPKDIIDDTQVDFVIDKFGLYAVSITARCKKKQDLKVKIDEQEFREIPSVKNIQTYKIPSAWNGKKLEGLSKTVIFIMVLDKGEHAIKFLPKYGGAKIEKLDIQFLPDLKNIIFDFEQQAKDGDKRPWITFTLINLPLKSITAEVSVDWHWLDGDDVKLVIDNKVERNTDSKLWKYWIWHATPKQVFFGLKKEKKVVIPNLIQGIHYLEFWADRTPTLHQVKLSLGDFALKRTSSKANPEWTENLVDDSEQIILARAIFGEARDMTFADEARIAVGWSIKNRVDDSRWADTYQKVITKPLQYSAFNQNDPNREFIENPLHSGKEIDKKSWENVYELAGKIMSEEIKDPTLGANHYHDSSISPPSYLSRENLTLTVHNNDKTKIIFFYRL